MSSVFVTDEREGAGLDLLRWSRLARFVLAQERVPADAQLSVIFVDEQAITDLNARFLEGDGPTDVLAFPIDDDIPPPGRQPDGGGRGPGSPDEPGEPPAVLGDVVLCPAVAARQAVEHGRALDDELALLVVHGVLHLLDYDHAEDAEGAVMRRREQELLNGFRAASREP